MKCSNKIKCHYFCFAVDDFWEEQPSAHVHICHCQISNSKSNQKFFFSSFFVSSVSLFQKMNSFRQPNIPHMIDDMQ